MLFFESFWKMTGWDNKETCLAAVSKDGWALSRASERLKDDKDVCLAAVSHHDWALLYASTRLKDDKDVCLAAVSHHGWALRFASERLKDDKDVCLAAVSNDGDALIDVSMRLRNDKDVCLAAVSNEGWALEFVSTRLKNDKDVCLSAISQNALAFELIPENFQKNNVFCLAAINVNKCVLKRFNNLPEDLVSLEIEGKHFSPSTHQVVTVHNKTATVLFKLCMKNCKKSVYGFPDEIQELVLFHVGSLETGLIERKDRIGEKRRINFTDDKFRGGLFSIHK